VDTTSDNVSTTQLEGASSYIEDTPTATSDNGGVGRPLHLERGGEQPHLVRVLAQPAAERVAGVVPVAVPVPQPVAGDAEGDGGVVAQPLAAGSCS